MKKITLEDLRRRAKPFVERLKISADDIEDWILRLVLVFALALFVVIALLFCVYQLAAETDERPGDLPIAQLSQGASR